MKVLVLTLLCSIVLCQGQIEGDERFPEEPFLPPDSLVQDEDVLVRCKRPLCEIPCIYGSVLAADGCPTCECKSPEVLCQELACPTGQRCHLPTCTGEICALMLPICLPDCPMSPMCSHECEHGYAKDENGCMINCDCAPALPDLAIDPVPELIPVQSQEPQQSQACTSVRCRMFCENGWAKDDHGCEVCQCQEALAVDPVPELIPVDPVILPMLPPIPDSGCSPRRCRMFCNYGFKKDEQGCEMCECRDEPEGCQEMMCKMSEKCEFGHLKDERGCDMCMCRSAPQGCPEIMCTMFCETGFQKNEFGCDICRCNEPDDVDLCSAITCSEGQTCRSMPYAVCKPLSICELHQGQVLSNAEKDMIFRHLNENEKDRFFPGPAICKPDGAFEPRQCSGAECFCVDDRGVMQEDTDSSEEEEECEERITHIVNLTFQLEHDMEDNDLEGAFNDIEELVRETFGKLMTVDKDSIVQVDVMYVRPGVLVVQMQVRRDLTTDLAGATHHLHKKMHEGDCDLHYKDHVLKPQPNTAYFKHEYPPVSDPTSQAWICWYRIRHTNPLFIALPFLIIALIAIIIIIAVVARKKRSARYQFAHRKMENMDTFKKNLIMSSEWEKPELVCKDDVKVTFSDEIEKKPLA